MFSYEDGAAYKNVFDAVAAIVISAVFITNLYEIFYLREQQQDVERRAEQLNIAKTHAELVALKNQIDPHFLFNSLNTLSYLISSDPVNARLYNDTLARVYRYILVNREKNLVSVSEEIEFLSNFFYLLKIRFDNAIDMIIEIKSLAAEELFLPPISLQIILENAIKHNELSLTHPLIIYVSLSSNHVVIKNKLIQKAYKPPSTGTGLKNLDNRYKLLTGKNITVYNNGEHFTVKLPLVNPQL
jgi:LytS/YehU family sensor histidine kinase